MIITNKKTLIYGGAFDPPHIAHLHILKQAIKYIKPNIVTICVDKISPWKNNETLTPFTYRLQMVKNLLDNNIKYHIYDNSNNFVYAYDIIKDIRKKDKHSTLFYLVGQDEYLNITKWKNYKLIDKLVTIVCYRRNNQKINKISSKHIILNGKIFKCSSTYLHTHHDRKLLGKNYEYIKDNHFYLQYAINKYMSNMRYQHTLRVLSTIVQIAIGNKFNDKNILRAQIAAILHDIAKEMTDEQIKIKISKNKLNKLPNIHCAHGIIGALVAKEKFNINDNVILDAIRNHVIFDIKSNNFIAKALFCADKLEPARTKNDIPNRKKLFEECCKNLNKTFMKVYKLNKEKY